MRFGINTFLFTSPFTNESTKLFKSFKKWGFDSVEIAVEHRVRHRSRLREVRVEPSRTTQQHALRRIWTRPRPPRNQRGAGACLDYVHKLIDIMTVLDSSVLVGPIYSAVGRAEYVPAKERKSQWKQVVQHLKTLCRYAEKKKKIIALEPLNRFETDFINTCDQAIQMVKDVGSPVLPFTWTRFT